MNFKDQESEQKLRGGYYTPQLIAELLCRWALSDGANTILEPGCGDGNFLQAIYKQLLASGYAGEYSIDAVEIVAEEAAKAERIGAKLRDIGVRVQIVNHDIFSWLGNGNATKSWNAIIGNPPYIRYQYFEQNQREISEKIFKRANVPFSKRTNAWVPLLIASIMHLAPGGRLAMVVPAELMHIQHANGLRQLFEQEMETVTLLNIREMVFPQVLQGVVLVLGVKKQGRGFEPLVRLNVKQSLNLFPEVNEPAEIRVIDIDHVADLGRVDVRDIDQIVQKSIAAAGEWMFGLLTDEEAALMRQLKNRKDVKHFAAIAEVDIGVVTGANNYFVVNEETVKKFGLETIAAPMLAKSDLIRGIIYTLRDHEVNAQDGKQVYLLNFPAKPITDLPVGMAKYIELGERQRLQERYKCRIRNPWYVVPYVWASEVSLLKRCHIYPRLVVNDLKAYSTDTAYRIRLGSAYQTRARDLAFSFINSLTFLSAEIEGRHYGGGVLELVPSEIEKLLIPLRSTTEGEFTRLDSMIRNNASLDEVLDFTDTIILNDGLGLTESEIDVIRKAHRRLLRRRLR